MLPKESSPAENQPGPFPARTPQEETSHFLLAQPSGPPLISDTGELSRKGKRNAPVFIALGLLTLFLPVISFDPPVQDRQPWSVWTSPGGYPPRPPTLPRRPSLQP
jgi:hypothetical protein